MSALAEAWSSLARSRVQSVTALDVRNAYVDQSIRTINGIVASLSPAATQGVANADINSPHERLAEPTATYFQESK